jgi:hypothetical protein
VDKGVGLIGKSGLEKSICRIAHFGVKANACVITDSYIILCFNFRRSDRPNARLIVFLPAFLTFSLAGTPDEIIREDFSVVKHKRFGEICSCEYADLRRIVGSPRFSVRPCGEDSRYGVLTGIPGRV